MKRILEVKKQIGTLSKNSKNPFFKSAYLDLNDLLNNVEPLLHDKGLILIQPILDNKVYSKIIDCENNNELLSSCIELPNISDPQKLGSAITYYRRYTLKSLLAISEGDDDANLASIKNATELLKSCTTLDELATAYKSLDKREQVRQAQLKDELKLKLK